MRGDGRVVWACHGPWKDEHCSVGPKLMTKVNHSPPAGLIKVIVAISLKTSPSSHFLHNDKS